MNRRQEDLLDRRRLLLGPAYRHFYEEPVEIVRGDGVLLFDAEGNEYLDAYNNVPCVGHANPRVTAAVARQVATLNTHTRYLSEPILDYSERLLATLGPPLERVMFTCSGSEAVDLALRVARFATGRAGVVATANAYHGATTASSEISPSLGPAVAPGPSVRLIPPPSPGALDAEAEGVRMAEALGRAVDELEAAGLGFAAFVCDPIFSSDGILPRAAGLLGPLVAEAHRRGGVFIADEVQAGFGRTGEAMWGFRRHRVAPDIVTMGKPMGNGMPIAATAFRGDLLESFGRETRFFSTFGGSSVAVAAASAVLDEIEAGRLQENAGTVGAYLLDGLVELGRVHRAPTDPRGAGLFLGFDLAEGEGHPSARSVVEGMRRRGVLLGVTGPGDAVVKIRPPLTFSRGDADRLLGALDAVLGEPP